MNQRTFVASVLVFGALLVQTGCANTIEAVGGATMAVGGCMVGAGAALGQTRDCDTRPCFEGATQVYGHAATGMQENVPLMIAGGAVVLVGGVIYVACQDPWLPLTVRCPFADTRT